jgi:hypothetical protein
MEKQEQLEAVSLFCRFAGHKTPPVSDTVVKDEEHLRMLIRAIL